MSIEMIPANGTADPDAMEDATSTSTTSKPARLPITVSKPTPYTFDLGNLLCNDANPLPADSTLSETAIQASARDCAQALVNQLLSACPITRSSDNTSMTLILPTPETLLPREKRVPADKPPTKWEAFAAKKGIKDKKRGEGKMVYDEPTGEWVPKWGYKGKNKEGENDWLVEVDAKKEAQTGEAGDARKEKRAERKEKVRRQERKMRANESKTRRA